jgi:hypothetical protein
MHENPISRSVTPNRHGRSAPGWSILPSATISSSFPMLIPDVAGTATSIASGYFVLDSPDGGAAGRPFSDAAAVGHSRTADGGARRLHFVRLENLA